MTRHSLLVRTTIFLCLLCLLCSFPLIGATGDTRVADAAAKGDKEAVRSLIKQAVDVNAAQGDGMTALHWAALNGDAELSQMLLYAGASVKATTRLGGYNPLYMAAKSGHAAVVDVLLNAGTDPNSTALDGLTPLMMAAMQQWSDAVSIPTVHLIPVSGGEASAEDRHYIDRAVKSALRRTDAADLSVFDFIRRCLLVETNASDESLYKQRIVRFAVKFQQVTAAVMAKGLEDTAFYRYYCLVALNEVGGNPARFGVSLQDFHHANQHRVESWPHSMLSSSTHDSKRSEDVRARIDVLSEMPALWRLALRRWKALNRRFADDDRI